MAALWRLDEREIIFPPIEEALTEPDGLLAIGGDLRPERLLAAYREGIFPWYEEGGPILWWSPDPRMVLAPPSAVRISRSMRKLLKKQPFRITMDTAFAQVIEQCADLRQRQEGTWITKAMQSAYIRLHELGHAHSVEVWEQGRLIGGLYGVSIGPMFFGESMFSLRDNASKLAFIALSRQLQAWDFALIDCQMPTDHLRSLGAQTMSRARFKQELWRLRQLPGRPGPWQFEPESLTG